MRLVYLIFLLTVFFKGKAQTTITIFPSTGTYNSGYVTSSGTKYTGDIQLSNGSFLRRGWAKFPLTAIPQNVTISSVNLIFYNNSGTVLNTTNTITGVLGDPTTMNGANLYNAIGTGNIFNSSSWSLGTSTNPSINTKSLTASAFVQQQLSVGHVCFGLIRGAIDIYSIYGISNSNYKIRLEVTYLTCQTTINSAPILPNNSSFSTGYVNSSGVKNSGDLLVSQSSTYGRGWARFPLSSIPINATITGANVIFYTYNGVSSALTTNTIKGFVGDPTTMNGGALYTLINNGTLLNTSSWNMGTVQTPSSNIKSLSDLSFIQSQLSTGFLNLGFIRSGSNLYSIYGMNNSNYTIKLELNYTVPLDVSISSVGPLNFCSGGSVQLNANPGTNLSYQWLKDGIIISGANSSTYQATTTGNYAVLVTTSNGCSITSNSIQVTSNNLPNPIISGANSLCTGNTTTLTVSSSPGDSFQWKKNGVNLQGETNSTLIVNSSGNYTVVATNSFGCSAISPISTVATLALPNATINSINPTTFCLGGGTNLSAPINSGYQYQWFKNNTLIVGATSSLYLATTTGSYKVFITNSSGCSNFSNNTINVNALPLPSLDIFGDSVICLGEMTTITVASDGSVTLNGIPNLNILQVSPSNTTEYNVVSQGTNGCTSSATLTIEVHYAEDTSIFMSSYGPLVMAGQTFTQSGVYTLDLNSVYGCDSTVTLNLNVLLNDIETIETSDLTIINPVKNGLIHILSEDIEVIEFNGIYDILGREISYETIVENTGGITIQISVPTGAYYIHFEQDGKLIQKKFVVLD